MNELLTAEEAIEEVQEDELEEEVLEEVEPEEEASEEDVEPEEDESSEDDEIVQRAKKYGHLSKEEWIAQGKNPDLWKSPEEFDKTGKILEQIYSLRKKVDQRDREIEAMVEFQRRTSKREYDRAKQELQSKLKESEEDMDVKGVAHYTKELTRLEDMEQHETQQQQLSYQQQAQQAFIERNQHWYNDRNPDLQQQAMLINNELAQKNPNMDPNDIAEIIEYRIQREHPERVLGESRKSKPVVSPNRSSVNKTAVKKTSLDRTFNGLSQELKDTYSATKRIAEKIDGKPYTKADFIKELKDYGEI